MAIDFRVIDTGVRDGRFQIAFGRAMTILHRAGAIPDTVRFMRLAPSAVVGLHQAIGRVLNLDFCRTNGVGTVRRLAGGGGMYVDPVQVGWELVLSRKRLAMPSLNDYSRLICEAVLEGLLKTLAIEARFRNSGDIEVGGRKLCCTGGFFDGDTLFYQGIVLVDADLDRITATLNLADTGSKKRVGAAAKQRIVTLRSLLGGAVPDYADVQRAVLAGLQEKLSLAFTHAAPTAEEEALAAKLCREEIGTDDFVFSIDDPRRAAMSEAELAMPGGTVCAHVRLEGEAGARRIGEVVIAGDFFVAPPHAIADLEASLRGVYVGIAGAAVERFFARARPDLMTIAPSDFRRAVEAAVRLAEP